MSDGRYTGEVMRMLATALVVAVLSLAPASPAGADVQVTMHNGVVSLTAKDATVRQILAEWARVGQTKIVNAEGIAGGPMTLQLINVPEEQALDIILRSVSGYLAAPRATIVANASRFDRIVVMPASAVVPVSARPPAASSPPAFPQARGPQPSLNDDSDDLPSPNSPPPAPPLSQRPPVFTTFPPPAAVPQPQPQGDGLGATALSTPSNLPTVSAPVST